MSTKFNKCKKFGCHTIILMQVFKFNELNEVDNMDDYV